MTVRHSPHGLFHRNHGSTYAAQTLAMRSMLPTEDLPKGVVLEKRCIVEVPLIPQEDVDRVLAVNRKSRNAMAA
jgi:hypothetical protein